MSLPVPEQFPKFCTCCTRVYAEEEWQQLRYVGQQIDDWEAMELRDCQCRSTLAVLVAIFQKDLEAA